MPSAIGREGPPTQLVRACFQGSFELVVSSALFAELDRVLATPLIAHRLEPDDVGRFRTALERAAIHVADPPLVRVVPDDPADDYLVALARPAQAHVIVTGDGHLLDLADLEPPALEPRGFVSLLEQTG